jgi:amino acid transporter
MKLQRTIGPISLLLTAMGSIIGSGWLFGPLFAAKIAGPAAIISWALGGSLMLFIAFTFAELATAFPRAGGMVHYGEMSHGPLVSYTIGWMIWLSSVVVAPVETLALLQYAGTYLPFLTYQAGQAHLLTPIGMLYAAVIMAVMVFLNAMGAKFFSQSSSAIVILKIAIPILVLVSLLFIDFHHQNFSSHGFAPYGLKGILAALPLGGIIFSFIGYNSAIQLSGEAKNPQRAIPFAVIGSVCACMLLYILIQTSFIGAIAPDFLKNGWANLSFTGDNGPFAGILLSLGMVWLVVIIYADAFISPFGTAYIYTAATARTSYALSEIGFFASMFKDLNSKGVPLTAMVLNFAVGLLLFFPFPAWQNMVEFLVSCFIIAYSIGPISLVVLRKTRKNIERPFTLPYYRTVSFIAFYICNMMLLWTGWETVKHLILFMLIGFVVFIGKSFKNKAALLRKYGAFSWWLIPYILGIGILAALSSFGGINVMPFGIDFLVMACFSFIIFALATRTAKY